MRPSTTRSAFLAMLGITAVLLTLPPAAHAEPDPERRWAHVVVATGYVDNVSICTWAVCGDPDSTYKQIFQSRGIRLIDLDAMDLVQQPGPGWWYVDGTFVRDSFERNVTARAQILGVELSWSTGGLGTDSLGTTFTVDVQPTGQRFTVNDSRLLIDPLEADVLHTFTVTATRPDGTTVQGPTVTATPQPDPDPDCTDHSVARECRAATAWAHVVVATGYVDNVSICTWAVCGDPDSTYQQIFQSRGIRLIDLDAMDLVQQPGPGWWYVDGTFVRDSFERNVTARAQILGVELSWSTGGLGTDSLGTTFTVDVQPTGQRFTVNDSRLLIDPLEADVLHTFTVTATRPDGTTVQGPTVTATPQPDPDPDCTDHSVARECRAATAWAVVHPETGMVENVTVCTPWQCGPDGAWGGVMPNDTPWPGYLLIELTGPGGIGWQYRDGVFVDVRPTEDPELASGSEPGSEPGSDPTTRSTDADADEALTTDAEDRPFAGAAANLDGTESDGASTDGTEPEAGGPSAVSAARVTSDDASSSDDTAGSAPGEDAEDPEAQVTEPDANPILRVLTAIASFFRGLFGR
jgi:hypothetical protein